MNQISREWLKSAQDDLSLIERILDEGQLSHLVAFHAQQAIEKCLKALLESHLSMKHAYFFRLPRIYSMLSAIP
ncbi:HEPN domain-containing protein [Geoalkalibacter halelectricus]|uniref:HEPN domain-containing protein n=1 Tax=Geoalkalibacter halelectricus TaxID=2847045 RepID=UPI003D20AE60